MKFHGRGNAYTEHWLDGRLHILDAYFNVTGIDDTIAIVDNREIKAPYTDVANYIAGMGRNEDVSMDVLKRICAYLQCDIGDIMEMIPEEEDAQA